MAKPSAILIDGDKPIVAVTVLLSEAEYRRFRRFAPLSAEGTVRNVMRSKLGLQPLPMGFRRIGAGYRVVPSHQYETALSMQGG